MIKILKKRLLFFLRFIINFFYQKTKYDNKYLYFVPSEEISKHESNFYEKKIKERKEFKFENSFELEINDLVLDNSLSLCDPINPLVNTANELLLNPNIKLEETYLFRYFRNFKPKNLMEVFFLNKNDYKDKAFSRLNSLNQYTLFYPWFHEYPQKFLVPGMFGPKDVSFPMLRYIRLKNLIFLIQKYGYIPSTDDQVCGYKLIDNKDFRFVITAGSHRSSVLKALNKNTHILVKFDDLRVNRNFFEVKIQDIKSWPGVDSGYISEKEAEKMFRSFFNFKLIE